MSMVTDADTPFFVCVCVCFFENQCQIIEVLDYNGGRGSTVRTSYQHRIFELVAYNYVFVLFHPPLSKQRWLSKELLKTHIVSQLQNE